ncbi:hypothetical protein M8C21_001342, partial [Ambrosia artemisiifolia]
LTSSNRLVSSDHRSIPHSSDERFLAAELTADIMGRTIAHVSRGRGFVARGGRGRGQGVMAGIFC